MNIKEIADMAGVSRATVSRYLNDGYVSEEKRERIRQVIEEKGMRGNMNELRELLRKEAYRVEQETREEVEADPWRLKFHLMPPTGWMNDPNGLCQYKGRYHVFFQYTPYDAEGGLKVWGHYSSADFIHWVYHGIPLLPDCPFDVSGVYSGSALTEDGKMTLFFTGNVKYDGAFDYVFHGREGNTILVESEDGYTMGDKRCVLRQSDYPADYTCHIRDPKVFREGDRYYMALGGRRKDGSGAILFYQSDDKEKWTRKRELRAAEPFGYMWECPDLFSVGGKWICSFSPQGVKRGTRRFQNIYHSGYVILDAPPFLEGKEKEKAEDFETVYLPVKQFREWDMGFDFYAPQTFEDESGRRILIGWMGLSDGDLEYKNPTVERGWQHALTLPREVTAKDGILYQYPVKEIDGLRGRELLVEEGKIAVENGCFDLELCGQETEDCTVRIAEGLTFSGSGGCASIELTDEVGYGRTVRHAEVGVLKNVRILADTSAVEIYLNGGEVVFTTRYYPKEKEIPVQIAWKGAKIRMWEMKGFCFD